MPGIQTKCSECSMKSIIVSSFNIGPKKVNKLSCGHLEVSLRLTEQLSALDKYESLDHKTPFPYQKECFEFLEAAEGRAIIADRFGLGKTIEALMFMALHPECQPFLVVAKSTILVQWARQIKNWCDLTPIIINDSKTLLPGFQAYIISYDRVRRFKGCPYCSAPIILGKKDTVTCPKCSSVFTKDTAEDQVPKLADELGLQTIILDECQQIKNTESARTAGVRKLVARTKYFLALSGAPIENNAKEYYPVLNMVKPDLFPTEAGFIRTWLDFQTEFQRGKWTTKTGGVNNPHRFQELTKGFIIRRSPDSLCKDGTKVMDQFPKVNRTYTYSDLGAAVAKEYAKINDEFNEAMDDNSLSGFTKYSNILAFISKMRHLTGLAKIDPCIDYVMEFLGSNDGKIIIFTHHLDVAEMLQMKLSSLMKELGLDTPLVLRADLDYQKKDDITQEFIDDVHKRVIIASTLASGEGLDGLQKVCKTLYMLERQWNPKKEENAEARLARIGQNDSHITANYGIAIGTVDEFFAELVEKKRSICGSALDGTDEDWNESSLIRELAERIHSEGKKKWSY